MNVYESCRTYSLLLPTRSLSLSLSSSFPGCSPPLLPSSPPRRLSIYRALSTHTECFIEIYDYSPLCGCTCAWWLRAYATCVCVCVYGPAAVPVPCVQACTHTHTHTHKHTRTSAAARVFFPSPLLHIIRANNILRIICMPYAALRAKSRKRARRTVRGSACPIGPRPRRPPPPPPTSPFFPVRSVFALFLS